MSLKFMIATGKSTPIPMNSSPYANPRHCIKMLIRRWCLLLAGLWLSLLTQPNALAQGPEISIEQSAGSLLETSRVVAWGTNGYGQTTVPAGLSGVQAVAADYYHLHISGVSVLTGNAADFAVNTTLPAGTGQTTFSNGNSTAPADERVDNVGVSVLDAVVGGSASQTFTIKNAGTSEALTGLQWDVIGTNAGEFVLSSVGVSPIAPNATSTLNFAFTPLAAGLRTATIRIFSNDPDESPFRINLNGDGTSPEIVLEQPAGTPLENSQIVAWGNNLFGQSGVPQGTSGVHAIAAGGVHTMALKTDGTLVAWGSVFPEQPLVPTGLTSIRAVAAGYSHTLALRSDGSVVAWGNNEYGRTTIPGNLGSVQSIAAGDAHSVVLQRNGSVAAWGFNSDGQATVPAGLTNVRAIAAGGYHTVALKHDDTVVAWGNNDYGQITIPAGLSGVQAISAGSSHTVALRNDGTVVAWGYNYSGQATVPVGLSGVRAIAAGGFHTVALKYDGTVVAWGDHDAIPPGLTGVQDLSAGWSHTVVLKATATTFGGQPLRTPSGAKSFLIRNLGTAMLHIHNVSITGADAGDFSVSTDGMLASVPPLTGQTTLNITFRPTGLGHRTTWLSVSSDDLNQSPYAIPLTGNGTPISPESIGSIPTQQVRIGTPLTMDLANYFTTISGTAQTYSIVTNSTPASVTASITGSSLLLTGVSPGITAITISVTNSSGSITASFNATAVTSYPILSPVPKLAVGQPSRLPDGSIRLEMTVIPGHNYQVETSVDLDTWMPESSTIQAGATAVQWIDRSPPAATQKRFYRVREMSLDE
jgi:hypothetical protein